MNMKIKSLLQTTWLFLFLLPAVFLPSSAFALPVADEPTLMEWTINGVTRKALVYIPATAETSETPLIFAFHGHGGSMDAMFRSRKFDQLWPEAIFVCPQGLNTPGMLTDPEGKKSGWKMDADETNSDLQFFDAMLKTFQTDYKTDPKRIFVTGHSNGGGFTYLLWALRGDTFAAVAASSTVAGKLTAKLKPKPVLHLTGEADPLVKPEWQKQTTNFLLKLNNCGKDGQKIDNFTTLYPSATKNPVLLFSHPGGHAYPAAANETIVKFFKETEGK